MTERPANLDATAKALELDAHRARYLAERDRRLRDEGAAQYLSVAQDFSHLADDPNADPAFVRAPVEREVEALVLGGGLSGLSVAGRLRTAGVDDFLMIEKGADFGGTWYWNRYPGLRCDTDAYTYLPFLEETDYVPTEKYVTGAEIFAHAQRIADHFRLYPKALLQTQVTDARWDDQAGRWIVTTDRGDRISARFLVQTVGVLDSPKLPGIPGIHSFKGKMFHTSRWDYAYTGGDISGGLSGLADKRVGIVGTGCTAIQCVPHLAEAAEHLYVFQRTPSAVDERNNRPTDPAWARTLHPGWHQRRRENFVALTSGAPQPEDLVDDGWTRTFQRLMGFIPSALQNGATPQEIAVAVEVADLEKMNEIRDRVDAIVTDGATAEALKPWYRYLCKRPAFSDHYLQTFNRPNVTLVATSGMGVESATPGGLISNGVEIELDCLIFATGFETGGGGLSRRVGFEIIGRSGQSLSDKWSHGYRSLHGMISHDFPNLFFTGVNQNAVTFVFTYALEEQAEHVVALIARALNEGWTRLEATEEAERDWCEVVSNSAAPRREFQEICTPGYFNGEGKAGKPGAVAYEPYGGDPLAFYRMVRAWRSGSLVGVETGRG